MFVIPEGNPRFVRIPNDYVWRRSVLAVEGMFGDLVFRPAIKQRRPPKPEACAATLRANPYRGSSLFPVMLNCLVTPPSSAPGCAPPIKTEYSPASMLRFPSAATVLRLRGSITA